MPLRLPNIFCNLFKSNNNVAGIGPAPITSIALFHDAPSYFSWPQITLTTLMLGCAYFYIFKYHNNSKGAAGPSKSSTPSSGSISPAAPEASPDATITEEPPNSGTLTTLHDGEPVSTIEHVHSSASSSGLTSTVYSDVSSSKDLSNRVSLPLSTTPEQPRHREDYQLAPAQIEAGPSVELGAVSSPSGHAESVSPSQGTGDHRSTARETEAEAAVTHTHNVLNWLDAPDPFTNHGDAREIYCESTGQWLLDDSLYQGWKYTNTIGALHLTATIACGKTILMSTVIDDILKYCGKQPVNTSRLGFFYFDTRQRYRCEHLVRSLIHQHCSADASIPSALEQLWTVSNDRQRPPSLDEWIGCLHDIIRDSNSTYYIIIDALDECLDISVLQEFLDQVGSWMRTQLRVRVLVSSRPSENVGRIVTAIQPHLLPLSEVGIRTDLATYVHGRLARNQRWSAELKEQVTSTLLGEANGRFRWVVCQLDLLQQYKTIAGVRRALPSLPRTLHELYFRILDRIKTGDRLDASRVFQWLIYSKRPLTLVEMWEALAVHLNDFGLYTYNPDRRYPSPENILDLCPGLLTTIRGSRRDASGKSIIVPMVAFSHTSVQEFLLSDKVSLSPTLSPHFAMNDQLACQFLFQTCELYLFHHGERNTELPTLRESFDFGGTTPDHTRLVQQHPFVEHAMWVVCNHVDEQDETSKFPPAITIPWKRYIGQLQDEQEAEDVWLAQINEEPEPEDQRNQGLSFGRSLAAVRGWVRPHWAFRDNQIDNTYSMVPRAADTDFWRSVSPRLGGTVRRPTLIPPEMRVGGVPEDVPVSAIQETLAAINTLSGDEQFEAMLTFMNAFGLSWDSVRARDIAVVEN